MTQVSPADVIAACKGKPVSFNKHVLGRVHESLPDGYWHKQVEVLKAIDKYRKVCVPAGHGTGKGFLASGASIYFLMTNPWSKVILLGPSHAQVSTALWPEVTSAWRNSTIPLPGRILNGSLLRINVQDKWELICSSADTAPEALAGKHAGKMLVVCDEASWEGYDKVLESLEGLNASNYLFLGNPLRNNRFRQLCDSADDLNIKSINISCLESPHADLDRSPVGMADRGYIEDMRATYGEDSPQWRARVLGLFNDDDEFTLIPYAWLDHCDFPHPGRTGPAKMGIDLSKGSGGTSDHSVIVVYDEAGILHMDWSNTWGPQQTAEKAYHYALQYQVQPGNVVFDGSGLGMDFSNRLDAAGLKGCRAYVGTSKLRSAAAWAMRTRLDPDRTMFPQADPNVRPKASLNHLFGSIATAAPEKPVPHKQRRFSIGNKTWLDRLRPELTGLRYKLAPDGGIVLEPKVDLAKRLGHSPDYADALLISFSI